MSTFAVLPSAHPRSRVERETALADPGFGRYFTDHMARATWTPDHGWHDHRVEAYGPLTLDPAGAVLHYTQTIFEGLKAFRWEDGSAWSFRPQRNAARFAASAGRLALPELPEADFLAAIGTLVSTDAEWVPSQAGAALYLRPFMFGAEPSLLVKAADRVEFCVIASPSGPFFASGFEPVAIWVSTDFHRAGPGGTGAAKAGANYAASLLPQRQAAEHGCAQVCYLDAATGTLIEEVGAMNVFVVGADGAVHTPALTGTFLEGVTRASVIELLRAEGRDVHERDLTLSEVRESIGGGGVVEAFGCGTGAVITPIGRFKGEGFALTVGDGAPGPVTRAVFDRLTGIQYGRDDDAFGWMHRLV